jgi:AraC-like DNA-binding protein
MNVHASSTEEIKMFLLNVNEPRYQALNIQEMTWNHWIISRVLQGEVEMTTCGETTIVQPGDVMIHPPNIPFSEINPSKGSHQVIFLDATLSTNIDLLRKYPVSSVVSLKDPTAFTSGFTELLHYWNQTDIPERDFYLLTLTLRLISDIITSWIVAGREPRKPIDFMQDRFQGILNYMSSRLEEKITRDGLASIIHLHPNYFDRIFNKYYRLTPMQMLRNLRLKKAKDLLETTDSTLETIASQCGLVDATYLSKVFSKQYEMTPGKYRKKMNSIIAMYR